MWKKGKPRSEATKRKISEAKKGSRRPPFAEATKRKMSESHKGKYTSIATRQKLSEVGKGNKNAKGHRNSIASLKKMSEAQKGRRPSEAARRKQSETMKRIRASEGLLATDAVRVKDRIRKGIEIRLWREAVFARDNWTCQDCGKRGSDLNAHHIKSFTKYPELRTSIENGLTLCIKCHKKKHKIRKKRRI